MRLQPLREGQIYQTRTGQLLTIVSINENQHDFEVFFEQGGIIASLSSRDFRAQVHRLIKDVKIWHDFTLKSELQQAGKLEYKHGEIWVDDQDRYWMVLRTLRSNSSGVSLIQMNSDNDFSPLQSIEFVQTSKNINLQYRATQLFDVERVEVLYKGNISPVIEFNPHNLIVMDEDPETGELVKPVKVGFGSVVAWDPSFDECQDFQDLASATWSLGLQDPNIQKMLHRLEYDLTVNRWR